MTNDQSDKHDGGGAEAEDKSPQAPVAHRPAQRSTATLALLALGVVYGDIGTSPLYAVKETFNPVHGIALTSANIIGGVSTIFWTLMIVVTFKYMLLVLNANNRGEGGIMALLALVTACIGTRKKSALAVLVFGLFGASLFYGDAVLTPAISVLSAVEGLAIGTTIFKPYILPLSAGILIGLFLIQRRGTGFIGLLFGPVCVVWFLALAIAGLWNILKQPQILAAVDPRHALHFVTAHGYGSFLVLGSVILAVTGVEALYADMGHFGKRAIHMAWFGLVAPALVLNYLGQGALLIAQPQALQNPFFLAFPSWALYPMVALATAATVIASQATISGAYSMTQQAIKLGYLPRMLILHTSSRTIGQIYMPLVNWILLIAVVLAVLGFGSSTRLASAYGMAVAGTMLITTILTFIVVYCRWHYPLWLAILGAALFLTVDISFFAASAYKVLEGGWFPLLLGGAMFSLMMIWWRGRAAVMQRLSNGVMPLHDFIDGLFRSPPHRVPGTAVFLSSAPDTVPHAFQHSLKHYGVLHECVVFLTVQFIEEPWVTFEDRVKCTNLGHNCWQVVARYGFMDRADVISVLGLCAHAGLKVEPGEASYFESHDKVMPAAGAGGLTGLGQHILAAMARNAGSATDFFNIPPDRVVELGGRISL